MLLVVSGLVTLGASPALPTTPHLQYHLITCTPGTRSPGAVAPAAVDVPVLPAAEAGGGELGGAGGAGETLAVVQLARARHHLLQVLVTGEMLQVLHLVHAEHLVPAPGAPRLLGPGPHPRPRPVPVAGQAAELPGVSIVMV